VYSTCLPDQIEVYGTVLKECTGESDPRSVCQQRDQKGKRQSGAAYADLETVRRAELF